MNIQYSYALPLGSFKNDVISNGSPRGFTGDILYGVSNKFAVGLGLASRTFMKNIQEHYIIPGDKEANICRIKQLSAGYTLVGKSRIISA